MKFFLSILFSLTLLWAQDAKPQEKKTSSEDEELSQALGESGNSPLEVMRALEKHLAKYPNTSHKAEIERALVKAAIETKDQKRLIDYGERVLVRDPEDVQVLDAVTRALLSNDDKASAEKALPHAKKFVEAVSAMRMKPAPAGANGVQWKDEVDKAIARALVLQSRAAGNLGNMAEAVDLARRSFESYHGAEGAREWARWLERSGKPEAAIEHLADAFVLPDPRKTDADQSRDRKKMGELYRKSHPDEKGLGDSILAAYDRNLEYEVKRKAELKAVQPNAGATKVMDFTLPGVDGSSKLELASLKGKTIIFDFWATWCAPCRAQQPLYEEVKKRFKDDPSVVFLSVSTDDDRSLVAPFVKEQNWKGPIYFDDGMARTLQISSIPTTMIVAPNGEIFSRMNGYVPTRFVDMLTERILDAKK